MERTFILVKPDGVKRGLVGEVIGRFEKKGFTLKGLKFTSVNRCFAKEHYADLSAKPFFQGLLDYLVSGPVVAMVWEGKNVIATSQKIKGATNPADSLPGTIRGDYAIEFDAKSMEPFSNIDIWNVVHGSDAAESAEYEIGLWFPEGIVEWQSSLLPWIYECS